MLCKTQKLVDSLRQFADFIEQHDLSSGGDIYPTPLNINCHTKEELIARTKGMGRLEKVATGAFFALRKTIGPFSVDFFIDRDLVCEAVTTKKFVPAEPAKEAVPEHEVEVTVWTCPPSLLATTMADNDITA